MELHFVRTCGTEKRWALGFFKKLVCNMCVIPVNEWTEEPGSLIQETPAFEDLLPLPMMRLSSTFTPLSNLPPFSCPPSQGYLSASDRENVMGVKLCLVWKCFGRITVVEHSDCFSSTPSLGWSADNSSWWSQSSCPGCTRAAPPRSCLATQNTWQRCLPEEKKSIQEYHLLNAGTTVSGGKMVPSSM